MDFSHYRVGFVVACRELLASLRASADALVPGGAPEPTAAAIQRDAHSLKGVASTFRFERMTGIAVEIEELIDRVRAGGAQVDRDLLAQLHERLGLLGAAIDRIDSHGDEGSEESYAGPVGQRQTQ